MNLKPLGDRIIVKQDEAQETTAGGLYIAADSKEKPQTGVVLAVGKGRVNNKGEHLPMPVKEGDRVLYGKYGGTEVDLDGEKVLILRADDVYAVYAD
jgi:chaperonin GroES